ncbi:DUF1800 family protein [Lewinella sp. 4G2]|uniref:DUF1800 domain-containing protein n=1 Tax=Lewinella sp. 4G2 TaxID=1803372 RepID=UPI0007B4C414|nr:DUF1800 domain-containing protein [Lewinella sp. 4G2]OAV43440.1 hypothetical protein A3850_002535 [Lewinella sp. 4G2]
MTIANCATTGLEVFQATDDAPWNRDRIMHLFRRAGYGATPEQINLALMEGMEATVDRLLDEAINQPKREQPEWAFWDYDALIARQIAPFDLYREWSQGFMREALNNGVREKLELFWQNHFVTTYESHSCPSYYYQYTDLIATHAFGDFERFVGDVGRNPAMLAFLNGFQNTRQNPNENYARELFELFTLGENNGYTQQDIVEASRALTGWNGWTSYCGPVEWASWGYDPGNKTVFGRTGTWNYRSLIKILFEERAPQIARFIAEKLYRYYVNASIDEATVAGMAQTFQYNDFQIAPVLRQLWKSAHFYDEAHVGALIKSPMDLITTWAREGNLGDFGNYYDWGFFAMANMGQYLGEPPDVAGWQGDRAWIDSNRLALRWEVMDGFAWAQYNEQNNIYVEFARELTNNSDSADEIARAMVDYFIPRGLLTEAAYENAVDAFKWEVPENYYSNGVWSLDYPTSNWQFVLLMRHIGRMPEFQLT